VIAILLVLLCGLAIAGGGYSVHKTTAVYIHVGDTTFIQDTLDIMQLVQKDMSFNSIYGRVVINASSDTAGGFGKSDSAWIRLVTVFNNETFSILKADTFASVPCTLSVNDSSLTNFFTEKLKAVVYISDTVMSMSSVPTYNVRFDLLLRDD